MQKNKIIIKSIEDIKKSMMDSRTGYDSEHILREADKEMSGVKHKRQVTSDSNFYKALTLFEFDKGILLLNSVSSLYNIFALEFNKNLQKEYDCKTPSEKSLAEIVVMNFVRVLHIQSKINGYLSKGTIDNLGIGYLNIMSKELDRAERHYLTSLQILKMLKTPALAVNIKTHTAIVGQNQVVQSNNQNDKAI